MSCSNRAEKEILPLSIVELTDRYNLLVTRSAIAEMIE